MTTFTIIIIGMGVMALIFSEYESKTHKKMYKKRPCQFTARTKLEPGMTLKETQVIQMEGLFHRFADAIEYDAQGEPVGHTYGIIEDPNGHIHQVDPGHIRFTDTDPFPHKISNN